MSFKQFVWACDPIGSLLLVAAATLMLLGLNWAGGAYKWSNPHVCANLAVGIVLLIAFCVYGTPYSTVQAGNFILRHDRMEGKVRRHRRTRLLLHRTQLLALHIRFCYRRVSCPRYSNAHEQSD